jgi:hypothetical protein
VNQQTFSLNRLLIETASGQRVPAYEILSARAVRHAMSQYVDRSPDDIYPHELEVWFDDETLNAAAGKISVDVGSGLVGLLAALQETYWHGIRNIWVGGGLVSGILGGLAVKVANARQVTAEFRIAQHPTYLGLLGIARYAPPTISHGLVFDFGGTQIKYVRVVYTADRITQLSALPSFPARLPGATHDDISIDAVQQLLSYMVRVIQQRWRGEQFIGLSVSTHMHGKQPISQGGYGRLQVLSECVFDVVQAAVRAVTDQDVVFDWRHDGTAAASAYTHLPHSAAITLGTALGGALAPETRLLPLAPTIQLK